MKFYKTVYRIIGLIMFLAGLALMPFIKHIIKDDVSFINVYLIFLLYLIQSVSSYMFFAYKSALIHAHQKEYVTTLVSYIFLILSNGAQIALLIFFKSFELFVVVSILNTIFMNIAISIICDRMYPYIKKKSNDKLSKAEQKNIFKDCYALFIYKINGVVLSATDNIIISSFIGLVTVGLYSNYSLIYSAINTMLTKLYNAINASLGNLHAQDNREHEYKVFKQVNFVSFVIFTVAAIGIAFSANALIKVWLGDRFIINDGVVWLLGYKMFLEGQKKVLSTYRNTMGLFQQAKYRPLAGAIINLVLSLILVKWIGLVGVILGTVLADLLTYMWYDPKIIYKASFDANVLEYYIKRLCNTIVLFVCGGVVYFLTNAITVGGITGLAINIGICAFVPVIIICIIFCRTDEFKSTFGLIKRILNKRK